VLRFDIDCVETSESDGAAHVPAKLGFRSVNQGRAHACGHDGHMAIGLAVAELLCSPDSPVKKGKIRLLFQPAEEGVRGGYAMTQAGLADKADYFIAFHLGLGNPTGEIYGGVHSFLCSTKIDAEYTGTAAHAGMEPHKGKNALLAACAAALNLHTIAPHKDGVMRLNVGVLQAGEGRNVVPPKAVMKIETRGETEAIAQYVYKRAVEVLEGAAAMYDIALKVTKQGEANTAASDEALARIAAEAASKVKGVTGAKVLRGMDGSDDACWYMKRVQDRGGQATYIAVGATIAAGHHNGAFDFDEAALAIGSETIMGTLAKLYGEKRDR
jgi:aminobenzoyl-glutamate utilization protein A